MLKEILVIDDNPDIRYLICNILKEKNFNIRSAANYDQAVLEINKNSPLNGLVNMNDIIIEAQKTSIKKSSDLISVINRVTKNREKSLLLSIINNDNRKRYIGVKLN